MPVVGNVELPRRYLKIIVLVARGMWSSEIGERLGTTEYVVKNYLKEIYNRTGMNGRLELTLWYLQNRRRG